MQIDNINKEKSKEIFNFLRDGKFLSQNIPNKNYARLFRYVENNYEALQEIYNFVGINLELRDGYCYFSSLDNKEAKLSTIYELLDILHFFIHFDQQFGVGSRFKIHDIEKKIADDITLKVKLEKIKFASADTIREKIILLINKLEKQGFIALEDEYEERYIALDSLEYLFEFFNKIEIRE